MTIKFTRYDLLLVWQNLEVSNSVWAFLPLRGLIVFHDYVFVGEEGSAGDDQILCDPVMALCPLHGTLIILPGS